MLCLTDVCALQVPVPQPPSSNTPVAPIVEHRDMTTECVICMDQRVSRYSPFATLRDVSELECEDGEKSQVETNIDISLYLNLIHFKAIFSLRWQTVRIFCCSLRKKYLKKAHVLIVSS